MAAAAGHGVAGIEGQIDEHLLQLIGVRERDQQALLLVVRLHLDREIDFQAGFDQLGGRQQQLLDGSRLSAQRRLAGEGEQLARQIGGPVGKLDDVLEELLDAVAADLVSRKPSAA